MSTLQPQPLPRHNPAIKKYHYHYAAIYYSHDAAALKASARSIDLTVGKDDPYHPDLPLLRQAYADKLAELREAVAEAAQAKAKEEAEKVEANHA